MIEKMLNTMRIFISDLQEEPHLSLGILNGLLESVDGDLKHLSIRDPQFLDGSTWR